MRKDVSKVSWYKSMESLARDSLRSSHNQETLKRNIKMAKSAIKHQVFSKNYL